MFKAATLTLMVLPLMGCVAQEEIILPTKYQRMAEADGYKKCVALATNTRFDEITKPELIVSESLAACANVKKGVLRSYPQRWRENYLKEVDAELYQRELNWIIEARSKKNNFFR